MKRILIISMIATAFIGCDCREQLTSEEGAWQALYYNNGQVGSEMSWTHEQTEPLSLINRLSLAVLELAHLLSGSEISTYSLMLEDGQSSFSQTDHSKNQTPKPIGFLEK